MIAFFIYILNTGEEKMVAAKKKVSKKPSAKAVKKPVVKKAAAKKPVAKKATASKVPAAKNVVSKSSQLNLKDSPITEKQTQAQIIADLADATNLEKKAVKNLFDAIKNQIQRHLKNRGSGEMVLPTLGIKIRRISKKATKARKGVNPFNGQPMMIQAKPARKSARATALKALKDLV